MKHRVEGAIGIILATIVVTAAAIYTALALLPDPDIPSAAELSGASPTYNIRAQSNRARINEAIPVSYGRNRQYPDIAAAPYNRYENNSQFLYQLFCLGQGEYDFDPLNDVYIEDIPINEYQDVTVEKVEPGDTVTLFDDNIYTAPEVKNVQVLSRNEVSAQGSFRFRTSQRRIDIVTPDGSYCKRWEQVFQEGDSITIDAADPAFNGTFIIEEIVDEDTIELRAPVPWPNGNTTEDAFIYLTNKKIAGVPEAQAYGATPYFTCNPTKTTANRFEIDLSFPNGIYEQDQNSGEYDTAFSAIQLTLQKIDDDGNNIGAPFVQPSPGSFYLYSGASQLAQAATRGFGVQIADAGRYKVSISRGINNILNSFGANTTYLTGLKAEFENIQNYGQLTMLAVKIKADEQLNDQTRNRVNVISTRKLPTWDGNWNPPTATRSIAWAIADIWMSAYGASRSYLELDLVGLKELDEVWQARGDNFDGVFDQQISLWEALTRTARCGRARPIIVDGILKIIRDESKPIRTALFNQRNIVKNSFNINYTFDDNKAPDGTIVKYIDAEVWKPETVQPDINATKPKEINLFGCTDYEQAYREGLYNDAVLKYRRTKVEFETELDGLNILIGDRIGVTHPMPTWAIGGEVIAQNGLELTLSEPVTFNESETYAVLLRRKDGSVDGPIECTEIPTTNNNKILLSTAPDFTLITDNQSYQKTYFSFGATINVTKDITVSEVIPRGGKKVSVTGFNYDERIYTADTEPIPPKGGVVYPVDPIPPSVSGLLLNNPANTGTIQVFWNPAYTNLDNYQIERSLDNLNWSVEAVLPPTQLEYVVQNVIGLVYIRIAGVTNGTVGTYLSGSVTVT